MNETLTDRIVPIDSLDVTELTLELTDVRKVPRQLTLSLAPLRVGTDLANELVVEDPKVSRFHCQLTLADDAVLVRDEGSKNGTWVENVRVKEALVAPGQTLQLGQSRITLALAERKRVSLSTTARFGRALGSSVAMRALFAQLLRAALTDSAVLLRGESGTGKELLAEGIHNASGRREGPFVVFDCGAVSPSLLEAELFGHAKGAFTGADRERPGIFETAQAGTLFLDEIGELPPELQPKLLRALESKQVRAVGSSQHRTIDVRVVAATHRDLSKMVAEKQFRADLYYRLAVLEATVPPLRDRRSDIPLLVESFLGQLNPPRSLAALPPNALSMLQAHAWPGNVRELRNVVSRLVLFPSEGALPKAVSAPVIQTQGLREAREEVLAEFEKAFITQRLAAAGHNVSEAARQMNVSRQFLHRLMMRYGL